MSNLAILASSKTQSASLFPVHATFRHDCPLAVKPASRPRRLVHKKILERFSTYWCAAFYCVCLGCCAANFGNSGGTYKLPCIITVIHKCRFTYIHIREYTKSRSTIMYLIPMKSWTMFDCATMWKTLTNTQQTYTCVPFTLNHLFLCETLPWKKRQERRWVSRV